MSEMSREGLLRVVRRAYAEHDPVPEGLIERMQTAAASEALSGLDFELMLLVESSENPGDALAGTRSVRRPETDEVGASAYTLRFVHGEVDVLVRIAPDQHDTSRIDGWVVPPEPLTVRAVRDGGGTTGVVLGDTGRFELTDLAPGLVRLRFEPHDGSRVPFLTPTFEI
ncbi:MAG: hypothetical protein QM638_22205 [Nocardioides sp.]|uniref:hypothetical protein n=1 Tax=Nocardioides sp. TaxID=35761 RepID=UPI0039E6B27B